MAEYRIEYVIQRRADGDDDFAEIGFGSSGAWRDLDQCTHMLDSAVTNGEWESEGDMPSPVDVMREISEARHG